MQKSNIAIKLLCKIALYVGQDVSAALQHFIIMLLVTHVTCYQKIASFWIWPCSFNNI